MEDEYTDTDLEDIDDETLFHQHVIQNDPELLRINSMLEAYYSNF